MSGSKAQIVQVTQHMLDSLNQGIQQAHSQRERDRQAHQNTLQRLQREAAESASRLEQQLSQQRQALANADRKLSERLERQQKDFTRKMREQAEQLDQRLDRVDARIEAVERSVSDLRAETHQLVQEQQHYTDQRFNELTQRLDSAEARDRAQAEEAQRLSDSTYTALTQHPEHYNKFIDMEDRELLTIKRRDAAQLLKSGTYQAAIAGFKESYYLAYRLNLDLSTKLSEWESYRAEANSQQIRANAARDLAAAHTFECTADDGERVEIETQVDQWTEDLLTELTRELKAPQARLPPPAVNDLSTEDLKALSRRLDDLHARITQSVQLAIDEQLLSQQRFEIAANIADRLSHSYEVVKDGYLNDAAQQGYSLLLRGRGVGDLISIRVDPQLHSEANSFEIDYFEANGAPSNKLPATTLRDIHRSISEALAQDIPAFECQGDDHGRPAQLKQAQQLESNAPSSAPRKQRLEQKLTRLQATSRPHNQPQRPS